MKKVMFAMIFANACFAGDFVPAVPQQPILLVMAVQAAAGVNNPAQLGIITYAKPQQKIVPKKQKRSKHSAGNHVKQRVNQPRKRG